MAKDPKVTVQFTGDASKLKRSAGEAEKALGGVDDAAGKLGDTAKGVASQHLGPLGEVAESLGADLDNMSTKTLAAGAAVVGLGAFLAGGVQKLGAMHDEIRKFNDASGAGWETSSRLVAVMDDVGISAETGAAAMGRLAKNIDAGKLEEFGIAAAHAKDGSVDLPGTLGNIADKMNATADPTKRAAIGTALLGKGWADLMPLLRMGSGGLADATASVKDYQIATRESNDQQREMELAVDDMQDAFSGLQMLLARGVVPVLGRTAAGISEILNLANKGAGKKGLFDGLFSVDALARARELEAMDAAGSGFSATLDVLAGSIAAAGPAAGTTAVQMQELADAERDAAKNAKDVETAIRDQKKAMDDAYGVVTTVADAVLGFANAQARTRDALAEVEAKQRDATTAVAEFGESSPEAIKAQQDYEQSVRDAESAAVAQAKAEVTKAEKLAEAEGRTLTAQEKTDIYTKSLGGLKDATNDPTFKSGMEELVGVTDRAATSANTAAANYNNLESAARRAGEAAAAAVTAAFGVGTQTPTSSDVAGYMTQRAPAAVGSPVINVNSPLGRPQDVIQWMRDELRSSERATK